MGPQQTRVQIACDLAAAGATVVTANTRAARSLRLAAEQRAWQKHTVCETPDVLPLDAWIGRTWTDCLLAGSVEQALLLPNVATALWEQIVAESRVGRELMNHRAAAELAERAWQMILAYRLPRKFSFYDVTEESRAFHGWAQDFEERCEKQSWIDRGSALHALTAKVGAIPKLPKQMVAFGFDEFTPAQQELWKALSAAGVSVKTLAPEESASREHAVRVAYADGEHEIRAAALWARKKLEENPAARIGVVVPGLQNLVGAVERTFSQILHPENALLATGGHERCFEISLGSSLYDHPIARGAQRMLRLATSGLSGEEWSALALSPYFGAGTSEAAGRARLDVELRKRLRATVTIAQLKGLVGGELRSLAPKLYATLGELERGVRKMPSKLTRSQWAVDVRRMLAAAGWPGDAEGELTLSSEEFQATRAWDDLFAEFGALDQVLPARAPSDLLRELERTARETTFAEENQGAPVQIAGPLAVSGESFDAIWFCGLSDEAWPQRSHPNPFLPFAMQMEARTPGCSAEVSLANAARVTDRLLQSANECVLSWPQNDEERALRPSPLLNGFTEANASEIAKATLADWNSLQAGARLEEMPDDYAPAVVDSDLQRRGTNLLEWQSGCPFRAFAQARLGAEALDEAPVGASPRDRGNVTELALQYVWEQIREWQGLENNSTAQIESVIASAIERALAEKLPESPEAWLQQHRAIERDRLNRLIHEWLDLERQRAPFRDVEHQKKITVKLGDLTLMGSIDRLERTNDGAYVVIDYKTGGTKYTSALWALPRPEAPQLPIYAVAQQIEGHEVAGVAFAKVAAGNCGFQGLAVRNSIFAKKPAPKKEGEFAELVASWKPELEKLAGQFLGGRAEVAPKHAPDTSKSTCRHCHLGSLCRVAESVNIVDEGEEEDDD